MTYESCSETGKCCTTNDFEECESAESILNTCGDWYTASIHLKWLINPACKVISIVFGTPDYMLLEHPVLYLPPVIITSILWERFFIRFWQLVVGICPLSHKAFRHWCHVMRLGAQLTIQFFLKVFSRVPVQGFFQTMELLQCRFGNPCLNLPYFVYRCIIIMVFPLKVNFLCHHKPVCLTRNKPDLARNFYVAHMGFYSWGATGNSQVHSLARGRTIATRKALFYCP